MPLDYELKNGDIISIKTNKNSFGPSENWLKIAKTSNAKRKIKSFLNKQNRDVLIAHGKQMVEEEFRSNKVFNYELDDEFAKETFAKNNISSLEDIYLEVAKSNLSAKTVFLKYMDDGDSVKRFAEESIKKQI